MKVLAVCFLAVFLPHCLAYKSYVGYKVYWVYAQTEADIGLLNSITLKYDTWQEPSLVQPAVIVVPPEDDPVFQLETEAAGLRTHLAISDLDTVMTEHSRHYRRQLSSSKFTADITADITARHFYTEYHTLQEIHQWMFEIAANYSNLVTTFDVGSSYEGRPMHTFLISTGSEGEKPAIWLDAAIHAREWVAPATLMYFTHQLLSKYGTDNTITDLLDRLDFYILPVFNVDGYEYTWTTDRLWRKSRSVNEGSDCVGTDMNRNFDIDWGKEGVSHDPCAITFCGSAPFSEIEVRNVAEFIAGTPSIIGYFAYHNCGQLYLIPYGYKRAHSLDHDKFMSACEDAVDAIKAVDNKDYLCTTISYFAGLNSGSSGDYFYVNQSVPWSFGVELRDSGQQCFFLSEEEIVPTGQENFAALLSLAQTILQDFED